MNLFLITTEIIWIGQNVKYDMLMLKWYGIELKGNIFDTMLAHYVIEPDGKRDMDTLSAKYLGYEPVHIEELIGKKGKTQGNMRDVELEKIKEYAAEDADITLQLKQVFLPLLKRKIVEKVFGEVENPLVKVLTDMEFEGVKIDENFLKEYSKELESEAKKRKKVFTSKPALGSILLLQNNWAKCCLKNYNLIRKQKKQKPVSMQPAKMFY